MVKPVLLESGAVAWDAWSLDPLLLSLLLIAAGGYVLVSRTSAKATSELSAGRRQTVAFLGGLFLIYVALASPLRPGGERLFSLHMLQHVVLSSWVPPLLLLGLPPALLRRLLSGGLLSRAVGFLTQPLVGAPIFMLTMWVWHVPPVYDAAVANGILHGLLHVSLVATGLLFWWTVVNPEPALHEISTGWRAFYVLFADLPMMLLAFFMVASQSVLYEFYETQPRLWGISAMTDQQLGGAIMGSLGEITLWIPFTRLFMRLMSQDDAPPLTKDRLDTAIER